MEVKVPELLLKAEQLAEQKMWTEAADVCVEAKEKEPNNLLVLDKLGWYLSRAKRYSESIAVNKKLVELDPNKAQWPYMLGYQFYGQQEWQKAIDWFEKSLALYPAYIKVLYRKGYAHSQINEDEESIKCFLKAIECWQRLNPDQKDRERKYYSDSAYQLGKIYLNQGLTLKAENQFSMAVKSDDKDAHKYYGYGKSLLKNGKENEAIDQLKIAIRIDSRKDYIKDCLAKAYLEAGEIDKGVDLLEKIPTRYRKHYVWRTLGELYLCKGDSENAANTLRKAVQIQPENHNYLFLLAKAHIGQNEPKKAYPYLKKAIEFRKQNYDIDFPEAEKHLNEILNDFPNIESLLQTEVGRDGIIKFYKDEKGYGFISSNKHQTDLFFHVSSVINPEYIHPGYDVKFEVEETKKGLSAVNVIVL